MIHYWQSSSGLRDNIYIPKYYNPQFAQRQAANSATHEFVTIAELVSDGVLSTDTGHEIGKSAYGTGDIPFVRTSDISNWEIKSSPKQGVSEDIYNEFAAQQDVQIGDILFVRDGTYLIGRNCFITDIDKEILYQSHVLKVRVNRKDVLDPHLLFLALNSPWVQQQIRSVQFTADIIDTIGQRFFELILPFPRDKSIQASLSARCKLALEKRMVGKAFIKHSATLIEECLLTGSAKPIDDFSSKSINEIIKLIRNSTVTAEFGSFTSFWQDAGDIKNTIYLPSYYDRSIKAELQKLEQHCKLNTMGELASDGILEYYTGDEIGKMSYGTGEIPFIRTSDFANWEINHESKQGVSQKIFEQYSPSQDVQENDILLVRDGTYLVGSSCIITKEDIKSIFCGGLYKIRANAPEKLDPYLLLGLLNSFIVKRQIRTKQFTRDVIDTIGNRIDEVVLPVPKSPTLRSAISAAIRQVVLTRVDSRDVISSLAKELQPPQE